MQKSKLLLATGLLGISSMAAAQTTAEAPSGSQTGSASASANTAVAGPPTDEQGGIEDIIVTATKREQSSQHVSLSVAAVTGALIQQRALETLDQVTQYTPNVKIAGADGPAKYVSVRGLGSGNNRGFETSVGLFLDGVYLGREVFLFDSYLDIARIEAIKGPQGALFGKNTIAGAISVVTENPTNNFSGSVGATLGENHKKVVDATVSGPITSNLSARITGEYFDRGGYIDNSASGQKDASRRVGSVRGKLIWKPVDILRVSATAQYADLDVKGSGRQLGRSVACVSFAPAARCAPPNISSPATLGGTRSLLDIVRATNPNAESNTDFNRTSGPVREGESRRTLFTALQGDLNLGEHTLTYIGSYAKIFNQKTILDPDATSFDSGTLVNGEDYHQWSHELRLTSPSTGFLTYIAGIYLFRSDVGGYQNFVTGLGTVTGNVDQTTKSTSVFGQATAHLTPELRVIGGARYIDEKKDANLRQNGLAALRFPAYARSERFRDNKFLFNGAVEYDLAPQVLAYGSFAQGYKAGGFNFFDLQNNMPDFGAEHSTGFEVGIKSKFLDNKVRLNVAAFSTKFNNLQVSFFNGTANVVGNAASARSKGIEAELTVQASRELQLNLSGAYLHARFLNFTTAPCTIVQQLNTVGVCLQSLSGRPLERAPDFTGVASAVYTVPLGSSPLNLTFTGDAVYSASYYTAGDLDPAGKQGSFPLFNARVALEHEGTWSIALVGKNIANRKYSYVSANTFQFAGTRFVHVGEARQIDVQLKYNF